MENEYSTPSLTKSFKPPKNPFADSSSSAAVFTAADSALDSASCIFLLLITIDSAVFPDASFTFLAFDENGVGSL